MEDDVVLQWNSVTHEEATEAELLPHSKLQWSPALHKAGIHLSSPMADGHWTVGRLAGD